MNFLTAYSTFYVKKADRLFIQGVVCSGSEIRAVSVFPFYYQIADEEITKHAVSSRICQQVIVIITHFCLD